MSVVADNVQRVVNYLRARKRAYQLTFGSPAAQPVLQDLAKFCRAVESCYHDDPRKHAVLEGRREVFLRITDHMNLTIEQLYALFAGKNILKQEGSDDA